MDAPAFSNNQITSGTNDRICLQLRFAIHELKNWMTSIQLNLVLTQDLTNEIAPQKKGLSESFARLDLQLARISKQIDFLLDPAFLIDEVPTLSIEYFDLHDTVANVISDLDGLCRSRGVVFETQFSGPPFLKGDVRRIEQILNNLCSNAMKYGLGKNVVVRCSESEGYKKIEVIDQGIGMDDQDQAQIFSPYFRSEKAKAAACGSGLGLCFSKSLAELHRGSISVESSAGQGSTFTLLLPQS